MTFVWHDALWLLLVLPVMIAGYAYLMRRRKPALRYASLSLVRAALTQSHRLRPHIPPLLFLVALCSLLLATARPAAVIGLASEQRTIVLAIDVSYSMAAGDVHPTRLAAAQAAAKAFVRALPRDIRVGVIAFAGEADMVLRPTARRDEVLGAIDTLQLSYNTAIGNGIIASVMTLFPTADIAGNYDIFGTGRSPLLPQPVARNQKAQPQPKLAPVAPGSMSSAAIVLLTDGRETIGVSYARAAELAATRGVRVYTVGFGKESASVDMDGEAVDVGFDERALQTIAEKTRGAYFHASDPGELNEIYRTLTGTIVLEKDSRELTALFAALGALMMVMSGGLSLAWCGRLAA